MFAPAHYRGNAEKLQSDWCRSVGNTGTTPCIASHQTLSSRIRLWPRETKGRFGRSGLKVPQYFWVPIMNGSLIKFLTRVGLITDLYATFAILSCTFNNALFTVDGNSTFELREDSVELYSSRDYTSSFRWTRNARAALLSSTHFRFCNHHYG